jgi:tetratricopeptide (TPR) repeat protein
VIPPRLPRLAALAAALLALAACERERRTVVAAPADPERREDVATAPTDAPPPSGASAGTGRPAPPAEAGPGTTPTPSELLAQVEAMKGELAKREKPLEVAVAIGNLYFQHARYEDAIGWYAQAIDIAEPGWKAYLALPAASRAGAPAPPKECAPGPRREYAELSREAAARAKRDPKGAAACWSIALAPSSSARIQRGNARLLTGDADGAIADHEAVLARVPDHPEALWYLGLALAESAEGDVAKLTRAGETWDRLEKVQPEGPFSNDLALARAELARRIAQAKGAPRP